MRVLLMTGKGGVGKTSVAAATGLRCAELGYKTLVLSTDPAHSLADSFDQELGHDPRLVQPNLWGAELDALMELEGNWGAVKRYITDVLQARGLEGIEAEELAILPGMDEIFSLVRMKRHYDEGGACATPAQRPGDRDGGHDCAETQPPHHRTGTFDLVRQIRRYQTSAGDADGKRQECDQQKRAPPSFPCSYGSARTHERDYSCQ